MSIMTIIMIVLIAILLIVVTAMGIYLKEFEKYVYDHHTTVEPIVLDADRESANGRKV